MKSQIPTIGADGLDVAQQVIPPPPQRLSVPLRVVSPVAVDAGCQPITVGVPLPKGRCFESSAFSLVGAGEQSVPMQVEPLACWSDGSVKWLLVDLLAPALREGTSEFTLRIDEEHRTKRRSDSAAGEPGIEVHVDEVRGVLRVDTGAVVFEVDRKRFLPFARVAAKDADFIDGTLCETTLRDARGKKRTPHVESIDVETSGPVRTTLLVRGYFPSCRGLRFAARLSFFAGTGLVQLRFTIHNPNRARHRGGLWDLGDAGSIRFDDLSLVFGAAAKPAVVQWKAAFDDPFQSLDGDALEIYQDSSGGENWQSRNHVNREGRVPCRMRGYRVRAGDENTSGLRGEPIVTLRSEALSLTVSMPEFWQQFPKALEVERQAAVRASLFPRQWDDLFELQGGEQKTHTVWLRYASGSQDVSRSLDWTHRPARAASTSQWYAKSGAIANFSPAADDVDERLQRYAQQALHGEAGLIAKREVIDEYGWRNYGDIWADHEQAYYDGPKPVISHYNNQCDVVYGAILQMMRSGDVAWFDVFDPLARHVVDIDVYRTQRDRAAYNGGLFWFTDHYLDAATSTHRTYTRANRPVDGSPYGGGPGSEHNFASGLLHYYYLTGEGDARDTVIRLAQWVVDMDNGASNVLGVVDDGPIGLASCGGGGDYHGPGRGAANSIEVLLDGWLASRDEVFLAKAEELIRRCIHPDDDVDARGLLDAEKRWSYTMFLSALARYLDVKLEQGDMDKMYAYARTALVRYAQWMVEKERPYLDRPEDLEYPTEAWAAQEFRKANIFLLAARHVSEAAREEMLAKHRELADRAWRDLSSFESHLATRAVAVVLKEAAIAESACRTDATRHALDPGAWDFGAPQQFVAQRRRVKDRLAHFSGVVGLATRMMMPTRWIAFVQQRRPTAVQHSAPTAKRP